MTDLMPLCKESDKEIIFTGTYREFNTNEEYDIKEYMSKKNCLIEEIKKIIFENDNHFTIKIVHNDDSVYEESFTGTEFSTSITCIKTIKITSTEKFFYAVTRIYKLENRPDFISKNIHTIYPEENILKKIDEYDGDDGGINCAYHNVIYDKKGRIHGIHIRATISDESIEFLGFTLNGAEIRFSGRLLNYIARKKNLSGYFITFEEHNINLLHDFVIKLIVPEERIRLPKIIVQNDL